MGEREQADVMMPDRAARARLCAIAALVLFTAMFGVHLVQQYVLELLRFAADDPAQALDRLRTLAKFLALTMSYVLLAVAVWLRGVALRPPASSPLSTMNATEPRTSARKSVVGRWS